MTSSPSVRRPPVARRLTRPASLPPLLPLLLAAACGHATSVDSPGDHWQRVESSNFRMLTDARPVHYEFMAARLEHLHLAIRTTFFPALQAPPLDVVFLNDETLFMDIANNVDLAGLFLPGVGAEGVIVIRSGEGQQDETVAGLGVASHLVRHAVPRAPPWLHLGFSSFLETAVVQPDGKAYFGQPPIHQASHVVRGRLLPLPELEKANWRQMNGPETHRHYATAWAFVHYLAVGGTRETLQDLVEMLKSAGEGDPEATLRFPIAKYEDGFRDYALRTFGSKPSVRVFVKQLGQLPDPALKVSPAPAAEVKAMLQAIRAARNK